MNHYVLGSPNQGACAPSGGRSTIGDYFIGNLLANSPYGADEVWPCEAVRKLLELPLSQHVGDGFVAGKINLRGVTTRAVFAGGDQERILASKYRRQAEAITSKWPQTANLLRHIAGVYQEQADRNGPRSG